MHGAVIKCGGGIGTSDLPVGFDSDISGIEVFAVAVKVVDAFFIFYPEEDEETAGDAQGKTKDIDGGISFMADDIAPGDSEKAFKHRWGFIQYANFLRDSLLRPAETGSSPSAV